MSQFSEWDDALEDALAEPFPRDVIQQKQKGGTKIDFVAWHHYARRLNGLVGGGWSIGTPVTLESGGKLIVGLPVTVFGTTRVNFGSEDEDKDDYGDAATNAWAQAFKRTLALFGMGLDMYDKRRAPAGAQRVAGPEPTADTKPALMTQTTHIAELLASRDVDADTRGKTTTALKNGLTFGKAASIIAYLEAFPRKVAA